MFEQLYQDFSNKILPKIAEGLVITKDYFLDLSSRYVKYLIVSDSIFAGLSLLSTIATIVIGYKLYVWKRDFKSDKMIKDYYGCEQEEFFTSEWRTSIFIITIMVIVISNTILIPAFIINLEDLIKDIFIPEVRIYEQYKLIK